jgi:hypothetical protein
VRLTAKAKPEMLLSVQGCARNALLTSSAGMTSELNSEALKIRNVKLLATQVATLGLAQDPISATVVLIVNALVGASMRTVACRLLASMTVWSLI